MKQQCPLCWDRDSCTCTTQEKEELFDKAKKIQKLNDNKPFTKTKPNNIFNGNNGQYDNVIII